MTYRQNHLLEMTNQQMIYDVILLFYLHILFMFIHLLIVYSQIYL